MARFSIGRSIGDAFTLIRTRPVSVFVWGLVIVLPILVSIPVVWEMLKSMPMQEGGQSDAAAEAMFAEMMKFQAVSGLLNIAQLISMPIAYAAVMRAVIRPRESGWFSLRLGMDELRVAVVGLAIGIGLYFGVIVLALLGVGIGFAAYAAGEGVMIATVVAMVVALIVIVIAALARVSMIAPASILYRDFAFEQGWRLARGQVGALVGMMVLLCLIVIVIEVVLAGLILAVVLGVVAAGGGAGFADLPTDPQVFGDVLPPLAAIWPWLIGGGIVGSIFYGIVLTLGVAPFASACRQLAGADAGSESSETAQA